MEYYPCVRSDTIMACHHCGARPGEDCPYTDLSPTLLTKPAVGAVVAQGECSDGEVCESCQ